MGVLAAKPQLQERGHRGGSTPRTVQGNRNSMIEINERRSVGGILYGPFILFTAYSSTAPLGRFLIMYTRVGDKWFRWDSPPGASYTTLFYQRFCKNKSPWQRHGGGPNQNKYCGPILDRSGLERAANELFTATISSFQKTKEQSGQDVGDPYKGTDPTADAGQSAGGGGAAETDEWWKPWIWPAAAAGGLLLLKRKGVI